MLNVIQSQDCCVDRVTLTAWTVYYSLVTGQGSQLSVMPLVGVELGQGEAMNDPDV